VGEDENMTNIGNPLDVPVGGEESEQWHLEARLRLSKKRFRFGLNKISPTRTGSPEGYTVGICEYHDLIDVLRPRRHWFTRLWNEYLSKTEPNVSKPAGEEGGVYRITGAARFGVELSSGHYLVVSQNKNSAADFWRYLFEFFLNLFSWLYC
jgi:hypothetical protein